MYLGLLSSLSILLIGAGVVNGALDLNDCADMTGTYGQTVQCPSGMVGVGLCASGRFADCGGAFTILKCCREIAPLYNNDDDIPSGINVKSPCGAGDGCPSLLESTVFGGTLKCVGQGLVTSTCTPGASD